MLFGLIQADEKVVLDCAFNEGRCTSARVPDAIWCVNHIEAQCGVPGCVAHAVRSCAVLTGNGACMRNFCNQTNHQCDGKLCTEWRVD